jgi:outer membrane protein assembly factor BamB
MRDSLDRGSSLQKLETAVIRVAVLMSVLWFSFGRLEAGEIPPAELNKQQQRNWHQWRGPQASGVAPLADPPTQWDEQTNIGWKIEIPGRGTSTPIIWEDQVFILTAIKTDRMVEAAAVEEDEAKSTAELTTGGAPQDSPAPERRREPRTGGREERGESGESGERDTAQRERNGEQDRERGPRAGGRGGPGGMRRGEPQTHYYQFVILAVERKTGAIRWQQVAREEVPHEGHHQTGSFAAASPTTDGEFLYASFGSRGIFCYDLAGNLRWERDLGEMRTRNGFGEGISPVIHGESLIVNWDHEGESHLYVLDARSGETRWQVDRDEVTQWATPLVIEHEGRTQVITSATNRVRSYDLASGELLWECGGQTTSVIPSPVAKDGVVICMSGFRGFAARAIPLDSEGDVTDTDKIVWKHDRGTPYVPSPLLYGDDLYFTESNRSLVTCLDVASGEPFIDRKRLEGVSNFYASPIGAADRVYFVSREGTGLVLKHARELEILATNQLDDTIDASPAAVGKQLFLRGEKYLYCLEER